MQIKTMPTTTTMFKSKWNIFMTKITPTHNEQQQQQCQRRRRSSNSSNTLEYKQHSTIINKRRKHSDAMSVGTIESTVSMADKFRQAIPFFRRRSSSTILSPSEDNSTMSSPTSSNKELKSTTTTIQATIISQDYCKQLEKLQSLYTLAVDELNYAEDSQGSSYYSGDLIAAREALDECAQAFIQLLKQTTDVLTREGLQSSMEPKLLKLEKKLNTLPEPNDVDVY